MPNITLSLSQDLKEAIKRHKDINWSEVARQAIETKVHTLEVMNELLRKSNLTERAVIDEARRIKKKVLKKYK